MNKDLISEIPPRIYLKQVADHCPRAMSTYLDIWTNKDRQNQVHIYKDELKLEYLTSMTKFRHDLLSLVKEGLVSINESPKAFHVDIIGWDLEEEEIG